MGRALLCISSLVPSYWFILITQPSTRKFSKSLEICLKSRSLDWSRNEKYPTQVTRRQKFEILPFKSMIKSIFFAVNAWSRRRRVHCFMFLHQSGISSSQFTMHIYNFGLQILWSILANHINKSFFRYVSSVWDVFRSSETFDINESILYEKVLTWRLKK